MVVHYKGQRTKSMPLKSRFKSEENDIILAVIAHEDCWKDHDYILVEKCSKEIKQSFIF